MKRIEFIAPVESMRGNLSGNQNLLYAENNNKAYTAPEGKQYARNYQPRFIGAKRAATNLKYFAVRTKSAVQITAAALFRMACLALTGYMLAIIFNNKDSATYEKLVARYHTVDQSSEPISFRKWVFQYIYGMFQSKAIRTEIARNPLVPNWGVVVVNPFSTADDIVIGEIPVKIPQEMFAKFFKSLVKPGADDEKPIVINVVGIGSLGTLVNRVTGIPTSYKNWNAGYMVEVDLVNPTAVYITNNTTDTKTIVGYLQKDGEYVAPAALKDGETFDLTTTAPA